MNKHRYDIVDKNGYIILAINSSFTSLNFDEYAKTHIVPLLKTIQANHNLDGRAYWSPV